MTNEHPLADARIGQIAIYAQDLARATRFYRDTLGLPLLFEAPGMSFFRCGEVRLLVGTPPRPEENHPSSLLYYFVGDIRATHAALQSRGVRFLNEPHLIARMPDHELWMTFFRDPDRNLHGLMAEVR